MSGAPMVELGGGGFGLATAYGSNGCEDATRVVVPAMWLRAAGYVPRPNGDGEAPSIGFAAVWERLANLPDLSDQAAHDLGLLWNEHEALKRGLADAHEKIAARTPWVTPLIETIRAELGSFGAHTPAAVRELKRERDHWRAQAIKAQEVHVAWLADAAASSRSSGSTS